MADNVIKPKMAQNVITPVKGRETAKTAKPETTAEAKEVSTISPEAKTEQAWDGLIKTVAGLPKEHKPAIDKIKKFVNKKMQDYAKKGKSLDPTTEFANETTGYALMKLDKDPTNKNMARLFDDGVSYINARHQQLCGGNKS